MVEKKSKTNTSKDYGCITYGETEIVEEKFKGCREELSLLIATKQRAVESYRQLEKQYFKKSDLRIISNTIIEEEYQQIEKLNELIRMIPHKTIKTIILKCRKCNHVEI